MPINSIYSGHCCINNYTHAQDTRVQGVHWLLSVTGRVLELLMHCHQRVLRVVHAVPIFANVFRFLMTLDYEVRLLLIMTTGGESTMSSIWPPGIQMTQTN